MKTSTLASFALVVLLSWANESQLRAQEPSLPRPRQVAVNILGEVSKPGRYVLPEGATALDALAAAGGQTPEARLATVKLIHAARGDRPVTETVNMKAVLAGAKVAPVLHDGDSLSFPRAYIGVTF